MLLKVRYLKIAVCYIKIAVYLIFTGEGKKLEAERCKCSVNTVQLRICRALLKQSKASQSKKGSYAIKLEIL